MIISTISDRLSLISPLYHQHIISIRQQMNVLLLSAGYGTRLEADLVTSAQYSHLVGCPKALLPVAGVPLSSRWMRRLHDHTVHCIVSYAITRMRIIMIMTSSVCDVTIITSSVY